MSIWLDKKYASFLPLVGYQPKTNGKYYANFRCCYCGDSSKILSKKRGWFLDSEDGQSLSFHCYNCGVSKYFNVFLKEQFPHYYDDYIKELFVEKYKPQEVFKKEVDFFKEDSVIVNLPQIKTLPKDHRVIKYCKNRSIPTDLIQDCYYTDNFYAWCKTKQPDTFKFECDDDPRLVFPFLDSRGKCFGLSGRSVGFSEQRYLTIKFDEEKPKVFGLHKFNPHKLGYLVEGQIDSLYIDNCLGAIGALGSTESIAKFCNCHDRSKLVIIPDNERRNKQTCGFIKKNLELGFPVVLWPEHIKVKDINDMVHKLSLTKDDIADIISQHTVKGNIGLLKLTQWRRS